MLIMLTDRCYHSLSNVCQCMHIVVYNMPSCNDEGSLFLLVFGITTKNAIWR